MEVVLLSPRGVRVLDIHPYAFQMSRVLYVPLAPERWKEGFGSTSERVDRALGIAGVCAYTRLDLCTFEEVGPV